MYKWANHASKLNFVRSGKPILNGLLHRVAIPPRLRDFGPAGPDTQAFDVAWDSGRVTRIEPVPGAAQATVLSAPVDVHVHIDKNYTVDEVGETQGDLDRKSVV